MAIQWGSWRYAGGNGMRVGIDVSRTNVTTNSSSVTFTYRVYTQNQYRYADNQQLNYGGNAGSGSTSYYNSSTGGAVLRATRTHTYNYPSGSYGSSPGSRTFSATVSGAYNGVTPTRSVTSTIPARPYAAPDPVSDVTATRVSDTQATVSWTNSTTAQRPYTSIDILRQTYSGSTWGTETAIATIGGSSTSYIDQSTQANRIYRYRVRPSNSAGSAAATQAASDVYMTPAAPSNVTAALNTSGGTVGVTWTPNNYTDSGIVFRVARRSGPSDPWTTVSSDLSASATSWEDPSPIPGVAQYLVVARHGSLQSPSTGVSNTITAVTTPLAPSELSPDGVAIDATRADWSLSWKHNHGGDGAAQTAAEIEFRVSDGSVWSQWFPYSHTGPEQSIPWPSEGKNNLPELTEWKVRTQGVPSEGFGPWSYIAVVYPSTTPTASITSPSSTVGTLPIEVSWVYAQAEGEPQTAWEAVLLTGDGSTVLQTRTGSNANSSTEFTYPAQNGEALRVRVRTRSAAGLWSDWAEVATTVDFIPPATPLLDATYDPCTGSMVLDLSANEPNDGTVPDLVNFVGNGSFEYSSGTVEVYRNRRIHPADGPSGDTTGYGGYRSSLSNPGGYIRATVNQDAAPAGGSGAVNAGTSGTPVTPGDRVVGSIHLRGTAVGSASVRFQYYDAANAFISNSSEYGNAVTLDPGTWAVSSVTSVAPALAATVRIDAINLEARDTGDVLDFRRATVEIGAVTLGLPFSGHSDTSPDPDLTPSWTGAVNASESILTGVRPTGVISNATLRAIQSTRWRDSGSTSVRLIPIYSGRGSGYFDIANSANPRGLESGKTYTVSATFWQPDPMPFEHPAARAIWLTGAGAYNAAVQAENVAGEQRLSMTFTIPPSGNWWLRVYNGGAIGDPDVWWDDLTVVEGTEPAPFYFDGDTPDTETHRFVWEGTPGDSSTGMYPYATDTIESVDIERRIDGGDWLTIVTGLYVNNQLPTVYETTFENDTDGWASNSLFSGWGPNITPVRGTDPLPPGYTDGAHYLIAEWGTVDPAKNGQNLYKYLEDLTIGQRYTFVARVYNPTTAGLQVAVPFASGGPVIPTSPDWQTVHHTFTATQTTHFAGLQTTSPVAGQKVYIDHPTVYVGETSNYNGFEPTPTTLVDPIPQTAGLNEYRAIAHATSEAVSISDIAEAYGTNKTGRHFWIFLAYGPSFSQVLRMGGNPELSASTTRRRVTQDLLRRGLPIGLIGSQTGRTVTVTATAEYDPDCVPTESCEYDSSRDEWEAASWESDIVCYRDWTGRRIFGVLDESVDTSEIHPGISSVSFSVLETDYVERSGVLLDTESEE